LTTVADILRNDQVDFTNMITHELPLERFGEGLDAMRDGTALEVVLYPQMI
jgi:threonine dehydrogenase-like Zn-dependent dehydrogenase